MTRRRSGFYESGGNAWARLKRSLDAADVDPGDIREVTLFLVHEEPREGAGPDEEAATVEGGRRPGPAGEEYEKGPTEPGREGHGGGGGGWTYDGDYPNARGFKGAVRPDTRLYRVLQFLRENGGWWYPPDVAEEIGVDLGDLRDSLSAAFHDRGFVDRRRVDPQPKKKGVQREYRLSKEGRAALAKTDRIVEGESDEDEA